VPIQRAGYGKGRGNESSEGQESAGPNRRVGGCRLQEKVGDVFMKKDTELRERIRILKEYWLDYEAAV
jgi:hypothetical protein